MPLLDHAGQPILCHLDVGINASATSATLTETPTGWPTGGANGKFYVIFNRLGSSKEVWLCNGRSGSTITVATTGDRGKDNTSATSHDPGETVECIFPAEEAHDNNQHIFNILRDDHTQYMAASGTRHDLAARHTFAALGWSPSTPNAVVANQAGAIGTSAHPAHGDHTHAGPVTGTPVAIGTANAAGSGTALALANHVHDLAAGVIDTSNFFTAGVVDSNALAAAAVIAGKLANGSINSAALISDGILLLQKLALEDPTDFAPSAGSFGSLGTVVMGTGGTTYGRYFKAGRLVVGWTGFVMTVGGGVDGNVPSGNDIRIPLPTAQRSLGTMRGFVAARARLQSGTAASGTGVVQAGNAYGEGLITAGAAATWDATTPFNWGNPGDGAANLDAVFFYVSNT